MPRVRRRLQRIGPAGRRKLINDENTLILREARKIVTAIGRMFAPICEVVLHDLTRPGASIVEIECQLSGRTIGDATTELGLARVLDRDFPDVVQNYANRFADGRPVKSTSVGLRNSGGRCIAAICMNMDVSLLSSAQRVLEQLTGIATEAPIPEMLNARSLDKVRRALEAYAAKYSAQPRTLLPWQRREAVHMLADTGLLQLRGSAAAAADSLGVSRATVYKLLKH
jgi:predicted transcriptional regulator YheO